MFSKKSIIFPDFKLTVCELRHRHVEQDVFCKLNQIQPRNTVK